MVVSFGVRPRSILLVLAGVLIGGALVALPVVARTGASGTPAPAAGTTAYMRAWSCVGRDFQALRNDQAYEFYGSMRVGDGYFQCHADLPHRAVVTRVRFTLDDASPYEVSQCLLRRVSLAQATAGTELVMAAVSGTGGSATPGIVRKSTTSITGGTVDRLNYAYDAECYLPDLDYQLGIVGVDVTYTITAANG